MNQDERPVEDQEPQPRLPHLEDPRFSVQLVGQRCVDVCGVFVFRDVLEELCYRAVYDTEVASATLLTGGWFLGPYGPYVEIDGFRDATRIESVMRYVHALRGDPAVLRSHRGDRVLGCCLVRPGSGGRMGPEELMLCNTFFNRPYHVLLVVDGGADAFGFYARDAGGRFHNTAAYVLSEHSSAPATLDPEACSVVGSEGSQTAEDAHSEGHAEPSTSQPAAASEPAEQSSDTREVEGNPHEQGEDNDGDR